MAIGEEWLDTFGVLPGTEILSFCAIKWGIYQWDFFGIFSRPIYTPIHLHSGNLT